MRESGLFDLTKHAAQGKQLHDGRSTLSLEGLSVNPQTLRVPGEFACSGRDFSWSARLLHFRPSADSFCSPAEGGLGEVGAEVTPIADHPGALDSFP